MAKGWITTILNLPRWPRSLVQSAENPIQLDRLEDASGVELQYPTRRFNPAEDRHHTWRLLGYGCLAGLALSLAEIFLSTFGSNEIYLSGLSAAALWVLAVTILQRRKPWWRWFVYFFFCPALTLVLFTYPEPYFKLTLAMLAAMYVADRFATHYFYLKTAVPMGRDRANRLRALWQNRFRIFGAPAQGVEFYKFSFATFPLVYAFLFYCSRGQPSGDFLANLPLLLTAVILLVLFPLVFEALAAFLFNRPYVRPTMMLQAFSRAVVEWFTYNRHGSQAPATFQSPAGNYSQRRRISLAVIVLFAAWVAPHFSRHRDEMYLELRAMQQPQRRPAVPASDLKYPPPPPPDERHTPAAPSASPLGSSRTRGPVVPPLLAVITPAPGLTLAQLSPETRPPLTRRGSPQPDAPEPDPKELDLEPYQKAMLERMPTLERADYLRKLRDRQNAQKQLEQIRQTPKPANPQDRIALYALLSVLVKLLYAIYPMVTMLLPPLYFLACCFTTAARVVGFYGQQLGTKDPEKLLTTQSWDDLVNRIQASGDDIEQNSLLLGVNAIDESPVIIPREVFHEHAHLLGDSGSGKTSLGMAGLIAQFIRFQDSSLVILDLKGDDLALFKGAEIEAQRAGMRFRWFTNELGRSSYVFNPLRQQHFAGLSLYQRADVLTTAMGLQYGSDYGRSYYSDANCELLYKAICKHPDVSSFCHLAKILNSREPLDIDHKLRQEASHLRASVNRLADCEALNADDTNGCPRGALENAVEFADLFKTPQVLYFYLPSAIGSTSSADIARFALYSLLSAAKSLGPGRKQVYLLIDEFQRIVAHNLEMILQTARSMNIAVILANQTLSDLKTAGTDLIPTVRANTRFKQIFAASDLFEQQGIMQSSGETIVYNRSWSEYLGGIPFISGGATGASATEMVTPRLRPNDILLASDHQFQSIVYVTRGKGYAQYGGMPFIMTSAYHIDIDEYELRRKAPWPERPAETITLRLALPHPEPTPPLFPPAKPDFVPKTPEPTRQPKPALEPPPPKEDPVIGVPGARIETQSPSEPPKSEPSPGLSALDQHWKDQQRTKKLPAELSDQ